MESELLLVDPQCKAERVSMTSIKEEKYLHTPYIPYLESDLPIRVFLWEFSKLGLVSVMDRGEISERVHV